ncbi:conserved hypothetical protein [Vibrio jasicida]|uniref:hypothetical protein n=1 Tax=Vibrio jasicida TaxID=766224 RepID=UPI0028944044|nr:conserved hypothetical protein [Vibrio jasicida]
MNYAAATSRFSQPSNSGWQPKPLNRTGDLSGWKRRMKQACPNPKQGEIVYLDRTYFDRAEQETVYERIGYKAINIAGNGEAIWQRGQVVRIEEREYLAS